MGKEQRMDPLLYIDQPLFKRPKAFMQEQYQSHSKDNKAMNENLDDNENESDVSFKHLSISGQINYLLKSPLEVPDIRCEIITKGKKYRGIVLDQNNNEVILRVVGRPNQFIQKADINRIRLLGF